LLIFDCPERDVSAHEKFKSKLLKKPHPKDVKFEELMAFLEREGFILDRSKGSHFIFERDNESICIPRRNPVKAAYIEELADIISKL